MTCLTIFQTLMKISTWPWPSFQRSPFSKGKHQSNIAFYKISKCENFSHSINRVAITTIGCHPAKHDNLVWKWKSGINSLNKRNPTVVKKKINLLWTRKFPSCFALFTFSVNHFFLRQNNIKRWKRRKKWLILVNTIHC